MRLDQLYEMAIVMFTIELMGGDEPVADTQIVGSTQLASGEHTIDTPLTGSNGTTQAELLVERTYDVYVEGPGNEYQVTVRHSEIISKAGVCSLVVDIRTFGAG